MRSVSQERVDCLMEYAEEQEYFAVDEAVESLGFSYSSLMRALKVLEEEDELHTRKQQSMETGGVRNLYSTDPEIEEVAPPLY